MLLVKASGCIAVFETIGGANQFFHNTPWACHWIHQFSNTATFGVRPSSMPCEHNITNVVSVRVGVTFIEPFTMPCAVVFDEGAINVLRGREEGGLILGVRLTVAGVEVKSRCF